MVIANSHFLQKFVLRKMAMLFFIVVSVNAQQNTVTCRDAIDTVLKRHPSILQAKEALQAVKAHTESLKSSNYPSVNAVASYNYMYPNDGVSLLGFSAKFAPDNMYDAHLGAEYILYDFGKRKATLAVGKMSETTQEDRIQSIKTALSYQVIQLFYSILLLNKSIVVADEGIASLNRHLLLVKKKLESGSATEYDALKTEVQRTSALGQQIDITTELSKKQTILCQLLGIENVGNLVFAGSFDTTKSFLSVDSLLLIATKSRSDYQMVVHAKDVADCVLQSAKLENLPSLNARTSAGVKNGLLPKIDEFRFAASIGAQMSMPLYDGKRAEFHCKEAEKNQAAAQAAINDILDRIKTDILVSIVDVQSSYAKLDISAAQVRFAQRSLELARLKYDAGVATNHDVLDAENDYAQALQGHLQNQYRFVMSKFALDQTTGNIIFKK